MKPHTAGIVAALVSIAGLCASPAVLNIIPGKYAAIVSTLGLLLQAITKGVQQGDTDLVPKVGS